MKKLLYVLFFVLTCTDVQAKHVLPLKVDPSKVLSMANFTDWPTYNFGAYSNDPYSDNGIDFGSYYTHDANGDGGTLSTYTDGFGSTFAVSYSISGNTLSYTYNYVPGADVDLDLHDFWVNDYNTYADYYAEYYETVDTTSGNYGNVSWSKTGTVDITGNSGKITLYIGYMSYLGNYYCNSGFWITLTQ